MNINIHKNSPILSTSMSVITFARQNWHAFRDAIARVLSGCTLVFCFKNWLTDSRISELSSSCKWVAKINVISCKNISNVVHLGSIDSLTILPADKSGVRCKILEKCHNIYLFIGFKGSIILPWVIEQHSKITIITKIISFIMTIVADTTKITIQII